MYVAFYFVQKKVSFNIPDLIAGSNKLSFLKKLLDFLQSRTSLSHSKNICFICFYLLQWKLLKNDENYFLFCLKSWFCFQDI